jgi:DNA-binding MarR family transcriptional regulator
MSVTRSPTPGKARKNIGLGKLLKGAHGAFNSALRVRLAAHDITFSQFQHLQNLWKEEGINQAELSRRIGITTASSTDVLDSLDRMGLIRRVRGKEDRRQLSVFLTPAGAALEEPLSAHAVDVNIMATKGLNETKIRELYQLLGHVIDNLRFPETAAAAPHHSKSSGRPKPSRSSDQITR